MKKTYLDDCRKQNTIYFDHECPNCGWDAITENGIKEGYCEVMHSQETDTAWGPGFELHIKCICPVCNEEFEYFDGSP